MSGSFDPIVVGRLESAAWVAYYRRNWLGFLRSALALSRQVAGLTWPVTILCSSLVLRAVRLWAPIPDNDPDGARRVMERFYRILKRGTASQFDPARAAALELDWWRVHRDNQYGDGETDDRDLAGALASLYAHLYDVPETLVRVAAEERTRAMR
ncbi:MAG: hypothetical protein ACJ780_08530, partial [Solirubrobacteraceae bacterium]